VIAYGLSFQKKEFEMLKTALVLLVGVISISCSAIFIRFCDDVPAIMIATFRLTIASLILLAIFKIKGRSLKIVQNRDLILCLLGGLFLSLHFISWITSLKFTSVANSVVLVSTNPIFVGLFSYLILKEKQDTGLIVGIILSFLGSMTLAVGDSGIFKLILVDKKVLMGDILALTGAVMISGYLIVGSRVRRRLDIFTYITLVYTFCAIYLLVISFVLHMPFTGYKSLSYLNMILLAIVPQLIGHTSFNWALKHLKTSIVAIAILGEPIGATLLAYIFFKETVDSFQLIGIIFIFAAIIIATRKGKKPDGGMSEAN
jgi:drug/metabolite transporter (DMT)-like permease